MVCSSSCLPYLILLLLLRLLPSLLLLFLFLAFLLLLLFHLLLHLLPAVFLLLCLAALRFFLFSFSLLFRFHFCINHERSAKCRPIEKFSDFTFEEFALVFVCNFFTIGCEDSLFEHLGGKHL